MAAVVFLINSGTVAISIVLQKGSPTILCVIIVIPLDRQPSINLWLITGIARSTLGTISNQNALPIGISFQDNGCGMSEEEVSHIFEPFFTTKKGYGTGLGLPITYGIIQKLGGQIKVMSRKGEGSVFTIYLLKQPK